MNNHQSKDLISRSLSIEAKMWKEIRDIILRKQLEKTQSDILAEMLRRFKEEKMEITRNYRPGDRNITKVTMSKENWNLYERLLKGSRFLITNYILRIWIEENN